MASPAKRKIKKLTSKCLNLDFVYCACVRVCLAFVIVLYRFNYAPVAVVHLYHLAFTIQKKNWTFLSHHEDIRTFLRNVEFVGVA